jgi:hypothetical protein
MLAHRLETIYTAFAALRGLMRQALNLPDAPLRKI